MAETEPNSSDEELISAYCDGELHGAELARAEELLASRPECRQLLEEYRAMRTRLQDVPQRTLGGNFAQRVLRRAERDILVPIGSANSYAAAPAPPKRMGWPQGRRPWVYAAMALAAALLIMLVESKDALRAPQQQLARHEPLPRDAGMRAPPESDVAGAAGDRKALPSGAAGTDPMLRRPESSSNSMSYSRGASPATAPEAKDATPATPPIAGKVAATATKEDRDVTVVDGLTNLGDTAVKQALDQLGLPAVSLQLAQQAATVERQQGGQMLPDGVLIVECNIAPQNRSPDPMVASFRDNSISVDLRSTQMESRLAKAPEPPVNLDERPMASNGAPPDMSSQEPVELFFVVATPEQLDATLADLGNRPGVSVNLLGDNQPDRYQYANRGRAFRTAPRQSLAADADKKPNAEVPERTTRDRSKSDLSVDTAQMPAGNLGSQQAVAQRLDISDKMRRLIETSPLAKEPIKGTALSKREAEQLQPAPAPAAAAAAPDTKAPASAVAASKVPAGEPAPVKQKMNEAVKTAAEKAQATPPAEPALLQRALFIVRTRPEKK
jgi:hypothetical protein